MGELEKMWSPALKRLLGLGVFSLSVLIRTFFTAEKAPRKRRRGRRESEERREEMIV